MARARMSEVPPAAKGTTRRIGLLGYWACAGRLAARTAVKIAARHFMDILRFVRAREFIPTPGRPSCMTYLRDGSPHRRIRPRAGFRQRAPRATRLADSGDADPDRRRCPDGGGRVFAP